MFRILLLGALIGLLFWLLPVVPAAAWSVIPALLIFATMYDALRRGQGLLRRRREEGAVDEVTNLTGQFLILQALWMGLHAPAPDSISGVEGMGGGLELTSFDGGFDSGFDGGAGGDGGI